MPPYMDDSRISILDICGMMRGLVTKGVKELMQAVKSMSIMLSLKDSLRSGKSPEHLFRQEFETKWEKKYTYWESREYWCGDLLRKNTRAGVY